MTSVRVWLPLEEKGITFNLWKDHELPGIPRSGETVTIHVSIPLTLPIDKVRWSLGAEPRVHVELPKLMGGVHHSSAIMLGAGWHLDEESGSGDGE